MATERQSDDSRVGTAGEEFRLNDAGFLQNVVRKLLQEVLETEMDDCLGAGRYEGVSSRRGYRRGHRPRRLVTRLGELELAVPTERWGRFRSRLFERCQRSEQAFLLTRQEMYLAGVSSRKVRQITEELCGTEVSASSVSRGVKRLDEVRTAWRTRGLSEAYPDLLVDARDGLVRQGGRVSSQGTLLIAAVGVSGRGDIIGVYQANTESEASWTEMFRDLARRGLSGVRLVVWDDHEGLVAAIRRWFQGAEWQRCQKHFLDNVLALVGRKDRR